MGNEVTLEDQVMDALLAGNDPMLEVLRRQNSTTTIKSREFSGCGFFTHFTVAPDLPCAEPGDFVISDVTLDVEGTENGASAMLFVRHGLIDCLEVVTHTGDWPSNAGLRRIYYMTRKSSDRFDELVAADKRDMEVTRRSWRK